MREINGIKYFDYETQAREKDDTMKKTLKSLSIKVSPGNTKTGRIPAISLTPIKTCRKDVPCHKKCYALKSYRMYKNVKNAWDSNTELYASDPEQYFEEIQFYIEKKRPDFFRWHVSGDIIDENYLIGMIQVANRCKGTKFLCFTKKHDLAHSMANYIPKNLTIILSMWPGMGQNLAGNYFQYAWCQDGTETRYNEEKTIDCPGNCEQCGMCWNLPKLNCDVVFNIH